MALCDPLCHSSSSALHFFWINIILSTTRLTRMTGISLHMQWPLTSQSRGSFLKENNWGFFLQIELFAIFPPTLHLDHKPHFEKLCHTNVVLKIKATTLGIPWRETIPRLITQSGRWRRCHETTPPGQCGF
jgi:hypothetical protein